MNQESLRRGRGRSIVSSADVLANSLDPNQWGGGTLGLIWIRTGFDTQMVLRK